MGRGPRRRPRGGGRAPSARIVAPRPRGVVGTAALPQRREARSHCPITTSTSPVSEGGPRRPDALAAGSLLLGAIAFCTLAGLGIGSLLNAPGLLAALGAAVGLPLGFWLVYSRY